LELNRIGSTVLSSCLTPLGANLLFIGSAVGDSLLIKCQERKASAVSAAAAAIAGGQTLALPAPKEEAGAGEPAAKRPKVRRRSSNVEPESHALFASPVSRTSHSFFVHVLVSFFPRGPTGPCLTRTVILTAAPRTDFLPH